MNLNEVRSHLSVTFLCILCASQLIFRGMNLLVVGHSVVDTIHYKAEIRKKPGGIFYSVLALDSFKNKQDEIHLCTALSKTDEYLFSDLYSKSNQQFVSFLNEISQVSLALYDEKEREEIYGSLAPNLELPVRNLNYFDGILINMITGFDISLDQFQQLRKGFNGFIYFDVHTFSRGISKDMKRFFRQIPDFNKWAKNIDIIQANEQELKTLFDKKDEEEISRELLAYGIKIVIITKAESGVKAYYRNEDIVESVFVAAEKFKVQNSVGCGDVFGAIFFYNYIRNKDIIKSLKTANKAAGCSTTYTKIEDYKKLKNDVLQGFG